MIRTSVTSQLTDYVGANVRIFAVQAANASPRFYWSTINASWKLGAKPAVKGPFPDATAAARDAGVPVARVFNLAGEGAAS